MNREVTSRHLRNAHELLLRIPIRQAFVRTGSSTTSYASRLRALLTTLYGLRTVATGRWARPMAFHATLSMLMAGTTFPLRLSVPAAGTVRCHRTMLRTGSATTGTGGGYRSTVYIVELRVGQNAKLRFVGGQDMNEKSWVFGSQRAEVARDGHLDWVTAGFGGGNGKVFTETLLAGEPGNRQAVATETAPRTPMAS